MAMDLLRSCYETEMRMYRDSDVSFPVRWFFVDDDAKNFPEHTLFGSGNWASDRNDWPGPGEVLGAPRTWVDGAPIPFLDGQKYAGPLDGFMRGVAYPGVPLHGSELGGCCACSLLYCSCAAQIDALGFPDTIYLRIVSFVVSGPLNPYVVGQRFTFTRIPHTYTWDGPTLPACTLADPYAPTHFSFGCSSGGFEGPFLDSSSIFFPSEGQAFEQPSTDPTTWQIVDYPGFADYMGCDVVSITFALDFV